MIMKTKLLSMALAGSLLFAGQAMATDLLQDDDLDRLSAAGEPTVIVSEGATASNIALTDQTIFDLTLPANAQVGLRALSIQNVVGELQLLVNLNVLSASASVAGTDQRNFSLQSWGSTLPDPDTVKTATASAAAQAACSTPGSCAGPAGSATGGAGGSAAAAAGTGAAGGIGGGAGGAGAPSNPTCAAGCAGDGGAGGAGGAGNGGAGGAGTAAAAPGGAGGTASANAAGNSGIIKGNGAAAASAVVSDKIGSASADIILVGKSANGISQVAFVNEPTFRMNIESNAQHDLSALFISNVSGRAQLALNLNIAAATLNLTSGGSFAEPIGNTTDVIKQVNTGLQFRGTPLPGATGINGNFGVNVTHQNQ